MAAPTVSCVCYSRLTILTLRNMSRPHKCWIKDEKMSLKRYLSINHCHMNKDTNSTMDESTEIPLDKLKVTYSRSSGPGGQHVNKVNTKAEVRFHLETADWISGDVKSKILLKYRSRINKAGELLVTSELSRSQQRNLRDCIQKISEMIAEASQKAPEPSEDDIALRGQRLERRNQSRLNQKKIQSATKRARRVDFD